MKFEDKDADKNQVDDSEIPNRMSFFEKSRPFESMTRLKSYDSNSEVEVTSVE